MRVVKAVVSIILGLTCIFVVSCNSGTETVEDTVNEITKIQVDDTIAFDPVVPKTASIGDVVTFGIYEQDDNTSNGAEQIEWIVLWKENGKALLTSKYALDCKTYNNINAAVTWETSDIRVWLNEDFYNSSFSENERSQIESTYLINDDNHTFGTEGGNITNDKVFLLSIDETQRYFASDEAMCCQPTAYAISQGAAIRGNGNCDWWLRSPGYESNCSAVVLTDYGIYNDGYIVSYNITALRPALWINLES